MGYYFDFHLHSCLSPCGDNDMTPYNMANMAALAGYQIIALSDHNTTKNCPAIIKAAEAAGIVAIPAMELTTMEEVHVLCLLPDLTAARELDAIVYEHLPDISNDPEIFGHQWVMDDADNILAEEAKLLTSATSIGLYDVAALLRYLGGIAIPAHIDRPSFSLIANLGFYDEAMGFEAVEITRQCDKKIFMSEHPELKQMPYIIDSDAHDLIAIPDARYSLALSDLTAEAVINAVAKGELLGRL